MKAVLTDTRYDFPISFTTMQLVPGSAFACYFPLVKSLISSNLVKCPPILNFLKSCMGRSQSSPGTEIDEQIEACWAAAVSTVI
jgi:hypothetical protein